MLKLDSDDFELFGLPRLFRIDPAVVDRRWLDLQAQVHPDHFASDGPAAQRLATQWAVRINEARMRLRDRLQRAAYLCELAGVPIEAETNTAMPTAFLMEQMEWREALDAASSANDVERLSDAVAAQARAMEAKIACSLDDVHDPQAAASQVRGLMFMERFADDVERRLAAVVRSGPAPFATSGR